MKKTDSIGNSKKTGSRAWDSRELADMAAAAADEKKAYDIVMIDIAKYSSLADFLVICTGKSTRQVKAIATNIEENLSRQGAHPLGAEGIREGRWALLDYNDVIVHVFYEPLRLFYDLEGLWSDAPQSVYEVENNN